MTTTTVRSVVMALGIDDGSLVKAAHEALRRPNCYLYYGDLPLFVSWGLTIARTRDSGPVEESNYRSMVRDLTALLIERGEDPAEYISEERSSHWGHGWMDQLAVRVLINDENEVTPDNITGAFRWVAQHAIRIAEEYPVYDESDLSELEHEASGDAWDGWYREATRKYFMDNYTPTVPPNTTCPWGLYDPADPEDVREYVGDLFDAHEEAISEAYYQDADFHYQEGSGMVNPDHERAAASAAFAVFGW